MANHKSSVKRARQTITKNARNKVKKSKMRNLVKKVRVAIEAKDKAAAEALLPQTQGQLKKLVNKGIMKQNAASRVTSRLTKQVQSL